MEQQQAERRGLFDGLQVPGDLNMFVLAMVCVAGFHGVVLILEWSFQADGLLARMVTQLGVANLHPGEVVPACWVLTVLSALVFWSFFSVAINRIAAMKIAREETVGLRDACAFGLLKFLHAFGTVVTVGVLYVACYVVLNATIFGWVGAIPWIGELLVALLYPFVLLFTFFVVASLLLGVFGLNLASSAISTESSDAWDGITRSWNYILVRPWTVLLVLGLSIAYITVFSFAASKFMAWSVDSLAIGRWGMGDYVALEKIQGKDLDGGLRSQIYQEPTKKKMDTWSKDRIETYEKKKAALDEKTFWIAVPSKVRFLRGYVQGRFTWNRADFAFRPTEEERTSLKDHYGDDGYQGEIANSSLVRRGRGGPLEGGFNVASLIDPTLKLSGFVIWCWRWLCLYAIAAYALQYLLGANTMLYFLLRREVDREDYAEIVTDEDELDDAALWSLTPPQPAAATAGAPGALLTPARWVGGPPAEAKDDAAPAPTEAGDAGAGAVGADDAASEEAASSAADADKSAADADESASDAADESGS